MPDLPTHQRAMSDKTSAIVWTKGEPIGKLDAAPDGAPCTVVQEWKDGEGRLVRDTREGYVDRGWGVTHFSTVPLRTYGFPMSIISITVTLTSPEWAEDRWVLTVDEYAGRTVQSVKDALGLLERATVPIKVVRLPKWVQDELDATEAS